MRLTCTLLATCLVAILSSPLVSAAQKYQYLLLSLNSQAQISLIKIMEDGQHLTLRTILRDFTKDPEFKDRTGNIAAKKEKPENEAVFVASRMSELMLQEQATLTDEDGLQDPESHYSFLYAAAGMEAMDGVYPTLPAPEVRAREASARAGIEGVFNGHGIRLDSIRSCGDAALVLRMVREVDNKPYMALLKSTYDIVYLVDPDSRDIPDKWESMINYSSFGGDGSNPLIDKEVPAGGVFSLGFMASARFFASHILASSATTCVDDSGNVTPGAAFAADFRKDLGTLLDKNETDLIERYQGQKRNNELGANYLALMLTHPEAGYVDTAWRFMVNHGAAPLAKHIVSRLPKLRKKLAQAHATDDEQKTPNVYVMGEYAKLYREFPFLLTYMNERGSLDGFRFIVLHDDAIENLRGKAAVSKLQQLIDVVAN